MDWNNLIMTLMIQAIPLIGVIYQASKDNGDDKENLDLSTKNSMLKMDLKRLCDAIYDDLPYDKLKKMAEVIEEDYRR